MKLTEELKNVLSSTYRKMGDEKGLISGKRRYSGNEVADEIMKESEFGLEMIAMMLKLTIDLVRRDKLNADVSEKPYFTKYIPIKGEISVGDMITNGHRIYRYDDTSSLLGCKLVKLFLCNKNIKVGDKLSYFNGEEWGIVKDEESLQLIKNAMDSERPLKIIGEISPDATWVKEGDEFKFGKVDKNDYICPYNQEDEKYIKFWTERDFRNLPNI